MKPPAMWAFYQLGGRWSTPNSIPVDSPSNLSLWNLVPRYAELQSVISQENFVDSRSILGGMVQKPYSSLDYGFFMSFSIGVFFLSRWLWWSSLKPVRSCVILERFRPCHLVFFRLYLLLRTYDCASLCFTTCWLLCRRSITTSLRPGELASCRGWTSWFTPPQQLVVSGKTAILQVARFTLNSLEKWREGPRPAGTQRGGSLHLNTG